MILNAEFELVIDVSKDKQLFNSLTDSYINYESINGNIVNFNGRVIVTKIEVSPGNNDESIFARFTFRNINEE